MLRIKLPFMKKYKDIPRQYNDLKNLKYNNIGKNSSSLNKKLRRGFGRFLFSLFLILLLFVAREADIPGSQKIRDNMRYLLTTEWNFQPVWDDTVRAAGQLVNWDNPLFNQWPGPAVEVSGENINYNKIWVPVSGSVVQEFGWKKDSMDGMKRFHPGINIQAGPEAVVHAAMDGEAVCISSNERFGKYIMLKHEGSNNYTLYAGVCNIILGKGQWVTKGQKIAGVDENGILHFELRKNGELVNPLPLMTEN
ncbi:MAG: M23 family metallopeptidase [Clostridiales bacterium]|nr:M23 family metallopeptidase [Clostridiales bacterium]MCF8022284.1 M23 family metallopeptidase [Clostridiales bacterium]